MINDSLNILKKYWGFSSFRPPQDKIINSILKGNDTIVLLPTGGGKSICFQIPALQLQGVCIVVSPLVALMQDQVDSLRRKGIKASFIESGTSQDDITILFDNLQYGNHKFLYVSPERIETTFIQNKIKQLNVSLITIDEAHCISEWGHDFRPSYLKIKTLTELQPNATVVALTATATDKVINNIKDNLSLNSPTIFKSSFYRDNLAYQIFYTEDKLFKLKQIFTKTKKPAIIYVNSRKETKKISTYLNSNGFKSSFYHGGLSNIDKKIAFDNWLNETTPIMVSTNAFGMGVDKPNVGIVIHLHLPNSLENYVQEAGRAGRNGKKAFSVTLINNSDIRKTIDFFEKSYPSIKNIKKVHKKLYQHFQISKGELINSAFDFNFLEFCNKYELKTNKTYNALQMLQNNGIIELNNNYHQKSTIQFLINSPQILQYTQKDSLKEQFITVLLRLYGGLFENNIKIDEFYLAKKLKTTSQSVIKQLDILSKEGIISYNKGGINDELYFLVPREDDRTINRISKNIESYLFQKKNKIDNVIKFVENSRTCRSIQLLKYFGEDSSKKCKICDICLNEKKKNINFSDVIFQLIKESGSISSKEICEKLNINDHDILINLRLLMSEEKIKINDYNKYSINK